MHLLSDGLFLVSIRQQRSVEVQSSKRSSLVVRHGERWRDAEPAGPCVAIFATPTEARRGRRSATMAESLLNHGFENDCETKDTLQSINLLKKSPLMRNKSNRWP